MFLGETFNFPQSFKGTDVSYLENVIVLNQIIEGRKAVSYYLDTFCISKLKFYLTVVYFSVWLLLIT